MRVHQILRILAYRDAFALAPPVTLTPRLLSCRRIDAPVTGRAVRVETAITEPSPSQIRT